MERFETELDAVLASVGDQGSDPVRNHLSGFAQAHFRSTTDDQHQGVGMKRRSLVDRAVIVFEIFLPAGCCRAGEHASAADARDMQARVLYQANAGGQARLFDLVPPKRDRGMPWRTQPSTAWLTLQLEMVI